MELIHCYLEEGPIYHICSSIRVLSMELFYICLDFLVSMNNPFRSWPKLDGGELWRHWNFVLCKLHDLASWKCEIREMMDIFYTKTTMTKLHQKEGELLTLKAKIFYRNVDHNFSCLVTLRSLIHQPWTHWVWTTTLALSRDLHSLNLSLHSTMLYWSELYHSRRWRWSSMTAQQWPVAVFGILKYHFRPKRS